MRPSLVLFGLIMGLVLLSARGQSESEDGSLVSRRRIPLRIPQRSRVASLASRSKARRVGDQQQQEEEEAPEEEEDKEESSSDSESKSENSSTEGSGNGESGYKG